MGFSPTPISLLSFPLSTYLFHKHFAALSTEMDMFSFQALDLLSVGIVFNQTQL